MRICSFLPSATEIIYALNLGDSLYGVTYECDYPSDVKEKPVVVLGSHGMNLMRSREIDKLVSQSLSNGESLYVIDEKKLKDADPDLVLTQGVCKVCAPSGTQIAQLPEILGRDVEVLSLDPKSLDDIIEDIIRVGTLTGRLQVAQRVANDLRSRIDTVRLLNSDRPKRKVFCVEWLDPIFNAGHWIPDVISIAGGHDVLGSNGASTRIEWEKVLNYDPEVLILMPCGYNIAKTISEIQSIVSREGYNDLTAVKNNQVYVLDGSAYFSRPGPRIVTGIEILANILQPDVSCYEIPDGSMTKLTKSMIS